MHDNDKAKEMCEDCGKIFLAGKHEFFCPDCRHRRLSEAAKRRKLSEIGHEARIKLKDGESNG